MTFTEQALSEPDIEMLANCLAGIK